MGLGATDPGQVPGKVPVFQSVSDELADKGFLVAQLDKLAAWAQTGSMCPLSFWPAVCSVAVHR